MIRRLFYLGLGAALGIYAMRRVERAARAWTPQGVAARATDQATALGERMKTFAAEVRVAADEREGELRATRGPVRSAPIRNAPARQVPARQVPARNGQVRTGPIDHDVKDGH